MLMSFWQEYTNRWEFVAGHLFLIALFSVFFAIAWVLLVRERRALKELRSEFEVISELPPPPPGEDEGRYRLGRFREAVRNAGKSSLAEHLRGLLGGVLVGEDYDGKEIANRIARAITWTDDLLRFSINALVVVGLMGTLYGFYRMWSDRDLSSLSGSQQSYLTSMSTALTVSFVGLFLGLVTNLFFAILKAARQRYVERAATFLTALGGIMPSGSPTHVLLQNLLSPLHNLVTELRTQNNEVLRGLTEAVNSRTEQLNVLIAEATAAWQGTIKEFRVELLKSLGDLQASSSHLAESSVRVAATMIEVSNGLERTKDIGQIVARLDETSGTIVAQVGRKLDEAIHAWAQTLDGSTQDFERAMRQQTEASQQILGTLTSQVATNFNHTTARMLDDLNTYKSELISNAETVSAKWLTEMSNGTISVKESLVGIVEGWQRALMGTSADINTALTGARELIHDANDLVRDAAQNIHSLNRDINILAPLVKEMSENAAAPILLKDVVTELDALGGSLRQLIEDLSRNLAVNNLHAALDTNTNELRNLASQFGKTKANGNGNEDIVRAIAQIEGRLSYIQSSVNALPSQLRPAPREVVAPPPEPPKPKTRWERIKEKIPWTGE
jgi:hypothetical protein